MTVTGDSLLTAESNIRDWLARLNDLCRIATFFYSSDRLAPGAELEVDLLQMFAYENLPEVTVQMELCRRFPGGQSATFSLIDTPGPDEAMQGKMLYDTVEKTLRESDAVIAVINGKTLRAAGRNR
jgi:hypothetical protein